MTVLLFFIGVAVGMYYMGIVAAGKISGLQRENTELGRDAADLILEKLALQVTVDMLTKEVVAKRVRRVARRTKPVPPRSHITHSEVLFIPNPEDLLE